MTRDEYTKAITAEAEKMNHKAVAQLVQDLVNFSSVPRRVDAKNWCSSCQQCWYRYLQLLNEMHK